MYIPIVPSSLLQLEDDNVNNSAFMKSFMDFSIKTGLILKTYDIDDKDNINKVTVEYDVLAYTQEAERGSSATIYKKCVTADLFGGIGDFFEFRRRTPTKNPMEQKQPELSDGSMVLLLCANGNSEKGIIIGGVKHPKRKLKIVKDAGMHMEGEYNGVNLQVNKEGELVITFKSKTDNEGKPQDDKAGGSFIKMDKTGSIELNDGNEENIKIDKTKKDISFNSEKTINLTTKSDSIALKSGKAANIDAKDALLAKAGGSATVDATGALTLKSGDAVKVSGSNVNITSDGNVDMKGSMIQLSGSTIMLGSGGTPAVVLSTLFLGVGNLGMPVIAQAIGPFSSSVFIAS